MSIAYVPGVGPFPVLELTHEIARLLRDAVVTVPAEV